MHRTGGGGSLTRMAPPELTQELTSELTSQLSEQERAILDFERWWWQSPCSKQRGIRDHLALSPTRYYRLLGELVDRPAAMAYDPLVVRRVRRARDERRRLRFGAAERERRTR